MHIDYLGFAAGLITTISFVPQLVRIYRTRSGRDISVWMMLLFGAGISLWLIYGAIIKSLPIIAANAITLVLVLAILVLKFYYARKSN